GIGNAGRERRDCPMGRCSGTDRLVAAVVERQPPAHADGAGGTKPCPAVRLGGSGDTVSRLVRRADGVVSRGPRPSCSREVGAPTHEGTTGMNRHPRVCILTSQYFDWGIYG